MKAVLAEGYKATVTTGDGRSISRQSLHPENALSKVQEWAQKQQDFADKHGFAITVEITPITGKRLDSE